MSRQLGHLIQARVRHRHHAGVRVDGAEREVLRIDARLGQGVEERRFADVRQADDAAVESHLVRSAISVLRPSPLRGRARGVQPVHHFLKFTVEQIFEHRLGQLECLFDQAPFIRRRGHRSEVSGDPILVSRVPHTDPQPMESRGAAEAIDHALDAVVTIGATAGLQSQHTGLERHLVVSNQNLLRLDLEETRERPDGIAGQIHEGLGQEEADIVPEHISPADVTFELRSHAPG